MKTILLTLALALTGLELWAQPAPGQPPRTRQPLFPQTAPATPAAPAAPAAAGQPEELPIRTACKLPHLAS